MKRTALVFVIVFVGGLILSSCNREYCPAYRKQGKIDTEQSDEHA